MDVKDKVIVVTGGADGIGAALCRRFAKDGARHVAVVDRNGDGAAAIAREIGGKAYTVDVSNSAEVAAMVAAVEADQGRIDLLCANAGVGDGDPDQDNAASSPDAVWSRAFGVNVMHLNTVSAAGLLSQIGGAVYSTTKHAAVGFAESLAITHGDHGIKVSILCPQGVDTAMLRQGGSGSPQSLDGVLTPEACADAVIEGLAAEKFLILPHPIVLTYMQRKTADYDRWIGGMRKLRAKVMGRA